MSPFIASASSRRRTGSPIRGFAWLLAPLFLAACEPEPVTPGAWFPLKVGNVAFEAQLAIDPATQTRGLMYRDSLEEDRGMLFVSERPRAQSFWMRNTLIPLDIGFFTGDGILREVYPLHPRDETPVVSRRKDIVFALEMNRGWFKQNGVRIGDRLDLDQVGAARRALAGAK